MQTRSESQTTAINARGAEDTSGASQFLVYLPSEPAPAPPNSHSTPLPVRAEPRTAGRPRLFGAPPPLAGRALGPRRGRLAQTVAQGEGARPPAVALTDTRTLTLSLQGLNFHGQFRHRRCNLPILWPEKRGDSNRYMPRLHSAFRNSILP